MHYLYILFVSNSVACFYKRTVNKIFFKQCRFNDCNVKSRCNDGGGTSKSQDGYWQMSFNINVATLPTAK